jgi:hypothetical protein
MMILFKEEEEEEGDEQRHRQSAVVRAQQQLPLGLRMWRERDANVTSEEARQLVDAHIRLEAIAQPLAIVAAAVEQVARNQPRALHEHLARRRAGTALLESIASRYSGQQ